MATDADVRARYGADGRVTVRPDSFTVVELASALEAAVWDRPIAVAGTATALTVRGTFFGEGAPVRGRAQGRPEPDRRARPLGRVPGPGRR